MEKQVQELQSEIEQLQNKMLLDATSKQDNSDQSDEEQVPTQQDLRNFSHKLKVSKLPNINQNLGWHAKE